MKYWLILIFPLVFGACQNIERPEKPPNLIGKGKMIDALTEAYLANAARSVNNKSIIAEGVKMDSLFYTKFGVDSLQFAQSNEYYASDVNEYVVIIQEVESRLDKMSKELDSIYKSTLKPKDSARAKSIEVKEVDEK